VTSLTDRMNASWDATADLPTWARETILHNLILAEQVKALTPGHTHDTYSKTRLAIEAIDREFGAFLVSKEGGE